MGDSYISPFKPSASALKQMVAVNLTTAGLGAESSSASQIPGHASQGVARQTSRTSSGSLSNTPGKTPEKRPTVGGKQSRYLLRNSQTG